MVFGDVVGGTKIIEPGELSAAHFENGGFDDIQKVGEAIAHMVLVYGMGEPDIDDRRTTNGINVGLVTD